MLGIYSRQREMEEGGGWGRGGIEVEITKGRNRERERLRTESLVYAQVYIVYMGLILPLVSFSFLV